MITSIRFTLTLLALTFLAPFTFAQAAWRSDDIGAVNLAGRSSDTNGAIEIVGAGADIWDNADGFHFRSQSLTGDGEIVARVTSLQNSHAWAKVGLMIRETTQPGSRHAMMGVTPANGTLFQYRTATNGPSAMANADWSGTTAPVWLKIARVGQTVTGFTSMNGATWTQTGTITFSGLTATVSAGLALTSHDATALCTGRLDNVTFRGAATSQPNASGAPAITARASENVNSGYLFTYQIVASNSPTSYSATGLPAGLTLNSTTGEIRGVCGYNGGTYAVTLRATNAAGTATATQTLVVNGSGPIEMPYIVRVTPPAAGTYRAGDTLAFVVQVANGYSYPHVTGQPRFGFTLGSNARYATYTRGSGEQYQTYTYTVTAADVSSTGVTSSNTIDLNGGTLQDSYPLWCALNMTPVTNPNVRIEAGSSSTETAPTTTAWQFGDIGTVGVAGSNSSSGNTITIKASGSDIWDNVDGFRFVYRQITGNTVVEAQVSSLTHTNSWTKAGVMIRQSLAPDARNVFACVTPNVVAAQARSSNGSSTVINTGGWTPAPYWVRLVRNGTRITAFSSPNGVTWTEIAGYDIAMTETVYVGFAVTSHDNSQLATAVFTDPFIE